MRERAQFAIGCAVLAAGAGSRFGSPGEKLVAPVRGRPLAQHAIDAAAASCASRCSLVVGAGAARLLTAVDVRRLAVYENDDWPSGLASSIRVAVVAHEADDAVVLLLADAPFVGAADIDALVAAWSRRPHRPAALRSGAVWGSPAIFPRSAYGELRRLHGDKGAKGSVLRRGGVTLVSAAAPSAFADVDRRADLSRLRGRRTR